MKTYTVSNVIYIAENKKELAKYILFGGVKNDK